MVVHDWTRVHSYDRYDKPYMSSAYTVCVDMRSFHSLFSDK